MTGRAPTAAVGFTIKSGWTAAVVVTERASRPGVVALERIELSDPAIPESKQPYHDGFGTARADGAALTRLLASVRAYGNRSVGAFITSAQASYRIAGAGLVVGSLTEPATIANDHIRIHALEGQLFREVVSTAAADAALDTTIWRERDLYAAAAAALALSEAVLKTRVGQLGRELDGPWRAEHKAAATAALMVLAHMRDR